jgi:hypothetical protein
MKARIFLGLGVTALGATLSGCMVNEIKPLEKLQPVQAQQQIPASELLDVAVREFDANLPPENERDEEALAKKHVYPDIRKAESKFIPTLLRSTLESSGQWGAVRVVPVNVEYVDVLVSGRILESTGAKLALEIDVVDSAGRKWVEGKRYESVPDIGSYKTTEALKARDPFQNVYSQITNDMLAARERLSAAEREDIRRVTALRFGADFAPEAMQSYLAQHKPEQQKTELYRVARLPAADDPINARVERIRDRDASVIDTVNGYYAGFSDQMRDSYGSWRQSSFSEIEKEERLRSQARTRTVLGAAAVLSSIFVPDQCSPYDYNCRRIQSAVRTAATAGGVAAVLSGIRKFGDARNAAQSVKELSESFQAEVAPQVIDLEGRTLRLTGSAEEQYREWRRLLREIYQQESGGVSTAPAAAPPAESTAFAPETAPEAGTER